MRKLSVFACAAVAAMTGFAVLAGSAPAQPEKDLSVELIGLRVLKRPSGMDSPMIGGAGQPGTTLTLLVRTKSGPILSLNGQNSTVASFTDEKGTDLKKGRQESRGPFGFTMGAPGGDFGFPHISDDGSTLVLDVRAPGLPAAGSSRLSAKGRLSISLGANLASARQKNVPVKAGTQITVGPVPYKITRVQAGAAGAFGGFSMPGAPGQKVARTITLKATRDTSAVSEINFYDGSGQKIETPTLATSTMRGFGTVSEERHIGLMKDVDRMTVEVKWWKDHKTTQLPFDVETGLALQ